MILDIVGNQEIDILRANLIIWVDDVIRYDIMQLLECTCLISVSVKFVEHVVHVGSLQRHFVLL